MRNGLAYQRLVGACFGDYGDRRFFAMKMFTRLLIDVLISTILILQSFMNGTRIGRIVIMREKGEL